MIGYTEQEVESKHRFDGVLTFFSTNPIQNIDHRLFKLIKICYAGNPDATPVIRSWIERIIIANKQQGSVIGCRDFQEYLINMVLKRTKIETLAVSFGKVEILFIAFTCS